MKWGCTWGGGWGEESCSACAPTIYEGSEPKTLVLVAEPVIGSLVDVGRFVAAVSLVPQFWYFGSIVAGTPTVDDC